MKFDITVNEEAMVVEEMSRRGFDVYFKPVVKNGHLKKGIVNNLGEISPTVYLEDFVSKVENLDELCDALESVFNQHKDVPEFDISNIFTKEYIKENVYPCVQKINEGLKEDIITRRIPVFNDLEMYFRLPVKSPFKDMIGSVKLSLDHIENSEITVKQLKEWAMINLHRNVKYLPMIDMLKELNPCFVPEDAEDFPLYVLTNKQGYNGAASVLDDETLEELCEKMGDTTLVIIPSSIHEVIVLPKNKAFELRELAQMIKEVNSSILSPDEILSDHPYEWSLLA